ncbi:MAG: DUF983 domain-containing protein [Acidimicrobiia bacterium]
MSDDMVWDHDIPKRPALTLATTFKRAAVLRCPLCGGRKIFRRWTVMAENCPTCGLRFERIEGHWIGSLGVNTVLSCFSIIAVLVVAFIVTFDNPSIPLLLALTVVTAIVAPYLYFPYAKTFWLAFDLLMRPLTPDDEVDVRYLPEPRKPW